MIGICALCGCGLPNETGLCSYHSLGEDGWGLGNAILCNFFHRGQTLARLAGDERNDDFWATAE